MFDNAYLFAALFWLAVWGLLYGTLKRHRRAMGWTGLLLGGAGPVSEYWFSPAYWRPVHIVDITVAGWRFGVEDYLVTFALAGICAGVYEAWGGRRRWPPLPAVVPATVVRVFAWCLAGLAAMFFVPMATGLNVIHTLLVVVTGVALVMLARRPALLRPALGLSIAAGMVYWVFYWLVFVRIYPGIFEGMWNLEQTWGLRWLGVPVEEFLWVSSTMLFAGPLLRACSGRAPDRDVHSPPRTRRISLPRIFRRTAAAQA